MSDDVYLRLDPAEAEALRDAVHEMRTDKTSITRMGLALVLHLRTDPRFPKMLERAGYRPRPRGRPAGAAGNGTAVHDPGDHPDRQQELAVLDGPP